MSSQTTPLYRVWGADNVAYGPFELPALVEWIQRRHVNDQTWIFLAHENSWVKAPEIPELKLFFRKRPSKQAGEASDWRRLGIEPAYLRRMKLFAELDENQVESLLDYAEVLAFRPFETIVKKGDHGDALFVVLDGELRVRLMINGRETILATMQVGDFFGEIALLDHGPRSADVVANSDSILLKISALVFRRLLREAPALTGPFLYALSRSVVGRIRRITQRYEDTLFVARASASVASP